jgi:hypothetical protein
MKISLHEVLKSSNDNLDHMLLPDEILLTAIDGMGGN